MGLLTPGRRVRPKRFDYEPRFYDPKKDEKIKKRMHVKRLTGKRRNPSGIIFFLLLFAMAVFVYIQLG